MASDLDALEDELDQTEEGNFAPTTDAVVPLALGYDLLARHEPESRELRIGLTELLNPVAALTPRELVDTLLDFLWYSDLGEDEQIEALGLLMQVNAPSVAREAEDRGITDFDPNAPSSWYELAESIFDEATAGRRR